MTNFNYEIAIPAGTESEATMKMNALAVLATKLSAKELDKLACIVKNEPVKTALAKKYMGL